MVRLAHHEGLVLGLDIEFVLVRRFAATLGFGADGIGVVIDAFAGFGAVARPPGSARGGPLFQALGGLGIGRLHTGVGGGELLLLRVRSVDLRWRHRHWRGDRQNRHKRSLARLAISRQFQLLPI